MLVLNDIQAGTIPLRDHLNSSRPRKIEEFRVFLKVLEVYGTGYETYP
jgi:hypothetical protein